MTIPSRINIRLDPNNEDDIRFYEMYSRQKHKKEWVVNCCLGYQVVTIPMGAEIPEMGEFSDKSNDFDESDIDFLDALGLDF